MKNILSSLLALSLILMVLPTVQAQDADPINVQKELKLIVKQLPDAAQLELLQYAQRRQKLEVSEGEGVNAAKELKKIVKQAPEDVQMELLQYAQRKLASLNSPPVPELAVAEASEGEAVVPASPAPAELAVPAGAAVSISANPNNSSFATAAPTATRKQPQRPAYMVEAEKLEPTTVKWLEEQYDFGKIEEGDVVHHTFKFVNTGDQPLKITRVKASCGCTTPSWTKDEIMPGEEGEVQMAFNSRGKVGSQNKALTITGNFANLHKVLRFKGQVVSKSTSPQGN